jgi:hypothetical protein
MFAVVQEDSCGICSAVLGSTVLPSAVAATVKMRTAACCLLLLAGALGGPQGGVGDSSRR